MVRPKRTLMALPVHSASVGGCLCAYRFLLFRAALAEVLIPKKGGLLLSPFVMNFLQILLFKSIPSPDSIPLLFPPPPPPPPFLPLPGALSFHLLCHFPQNLQEAATTGRNVKGGDWRELTILDCVQVVLASSERGVIGFGVVASADEVQISCLCVGSDLRQGASFGWAKHPRIWGIFNPPGSDSN